MSEQRNHKADVRYWRSLEATREDARPDETSRREFPEGVLESAETISRRNFLTLMGASMALAGLAGCRRPVEKIIPYVAQPEEIIPGIPQYYATTMPFGASAYGLLVESHEGRPTKIEGNESHPSTLGRSNALMQAEILSLYDPDRSAAVLHNGTVADWDSFVADWQKRYSAFLDSGGEGLAVLIEPFSSPTLARLQAAFLKRFPHGDFVSYAPISDENILAGIADIDQEHRLLRPDYRFDLARVILALDADILLTESENVVNAGRFVDGRRLVDENSPMNRLYVVEPDFTITGAAADHRLPLSRRKVLAFATALVSALARQGVNAGFGNTPTSSIDGRIDRRWLDTVARDLADNKGKSLIVAGRSQPPSVHALVAVLNAALGNVGSTVVYRETRDVALSSFRDLALLTEKMRSGRIKTLVMIGGNPTFGAAGETGFEKALKDISHTIYLGRYVDETSRSAAWHLPQAHFLEYWGDARAADGTASIIQPLIQPLFGGRSDVELLALLVGGTVRPGYDVVRETWQEILGSNDFENRWRRVLHDGLLPGSDLPPVAIRIVPDRLASTIANNAAVTTTSSDNGLELCFQVSPNMYDGRYANNGWLQELPHPATKLTWDNAAVISPATARALNVSEGDIVNLNTAQGTVELPILMLPGVADDTVVVDFGYGRTAAGRIGTGIGANAFTIRPDRDAYYAAPVKLVKTGGNHRLGSTQNHWSMEGRPIVREADLDAYRAEPDFAEKMVEHPPLKSIYPDHDYSHGYQWGMVIDLTACIGCNACTIACQSENNIPIVGREQVIRNREMHWLRLDRYFTGSPDNPGMVHQPVACQHCENAPCEEVCPVAATVHDKEGLNVMAYNRCIGTRYCSNNCPYKVRRFNFFNYTKDTPELVKMAHNPDVTVRSRGVMEKCTFCVQRLNRAKIKAKEMNKTMPDGGVKTACQQACPAGAIVFGNINDPDSRVVNAKRNSRNYALLGEFNIRPRNSYLAKIRNPHPDLKGHGPRKGE